MPKTWFFSDRHSAPSPFHRAIRSYKVSYLIRRKYAPAKSATGQLAHLIEIRSLPLGAANLFVFQDPVSPAPLHLLELRLRFPRGKPPLSPSSTLLGDIDAKSSGHLPGFQPDDLIKCCGDVCLLYNLPCSQPASHFKHHINSNHSRLHAASLGL